MEISALTRSVVKRSHAIIAPDGYINSNVPGWSDCTVNVIINERMGAEFCQTLITATASTKLTGNTDASQIFFYVIKGKGSVKIDSDKKELTQGQFVYVPIGKKYEFDKFKKDTQILTFHKVYEMLEGYATPKTIFGHAAKVKAPE